MLTAENGNIEFDTYNQPDWKHNLYNHYLALVYRYTDEAGQSHDCGTIIKTRSQSGSKEAEAISRRLLNFSPRLKSWKENRVRFLSERLEPVKQRV